LSSVDTEQAVLLTIACFSPDGRRVLTTNGHKGARLAMGSELTLTAAAAGARGRREKLTRCRQLLGSTASVTTPTDATCRTDYRDRLEALTGISLRVCAACHHGQKCSAFR
jgi:hypothetical protein